MQPDIDNIYIKWRPIDRRLFLHLIDARDTKEVQCEFARWLVRRCAIKLVRSKINIIIKSEPKASRRKKRETIEDQNKKKAEALNNAKDKVIFQLEKLPVDKQIDFLNENPIGWLTKRKGGEYDRDKHIYPDNVQTDYYYVLKNEGKLPHFDLEQEAYNNRCANSIIFKYIKQNNDLYALEQSWIKTNSTKWVPPSFMLSLIIEEVYTKQRDINTLPVKLAKLIKTHNWKLNEISYSWRLKWYLGNTWPQLKRRFMLGESAQKLDTITAQFVHPDTSNDVMPEQVQTVARTRASFGLHYK